MELKKLTIIALAIFYSLFLFIISLGAILSDFISVRQNVLSHSKKTETLILSKNFWESIPEKKEFVYNNNYYDVKKIVIYNKIVKVDVVKDEFEQIMKGFSKNLNSKNKKSKSTNFKKIIVAYFSYNTNNNKISTNKLEKDFTPFPFEKNKFLIAVFRPPCFS
jgi:hypothetical protein